MKKLTSLTALLILCLSCANNDPLNSSDITDKEDRIEELSEQITPFSDIEDAEFNLFKTGGFEHRGSDLGPTDIFYQFAVKVKPQDAIKWTKGLTETTADINKEEPWITHITKARNANWKTTSKPKFYTLKDADLLLIMYEKEGIIFYRISQT
jgi:hypothetical protein